MSGYDSDYNYRNYDSSTKTYMNYGTDEIRIHNGVGLQPDAQDTYDSDLDSWLDY